MDTGKKPDYNKAQNKALELLNKLGIAKPPIDPVQIAGVLGIRVHLTNFTDNTITGLYDFKNKIIYIKQNTHISNQIFTVARELGHILLHDKLAMSDKCNYLSKNNGKTEEYRLHHSSIETQEADVFAINLLVPKKILNEYKNLANPMELAQLFCVSLDVINGRLNF